MVMPFNGANGSAYSTAFGAQPLQNGPTQSTWMQGFPPGSAFMGMMPVPVELASQLSMATQGFVPSEQRASTSTMAVASKSVIGSRDDFRAITQAVQSGLDNHKTHRQILEELDGVHGHGAATWKDYYLDEREAIDAKLSQHDSEPRAPTPSANAAHDALESQVKVKAKKPKFEVASRPSVLSKTLVAIPPSKSSKNGPRSSYGANARKPRNAPRSPTPPSNPVSTHGTQFAYTSEDKNWFIDVLNYFHQHSPELSSAAVTRYLGEKAPHHSSDSWAWHWKRSGDTLPSHLRLNSWLVHAATSAPPRKSNNNDLRSEALSSDSELSSDFGSPSSEAEKVLNKIKRAAPKQHEETTPRYIRVPPLVKTPGVGRGEKSVDVESSDDEAKKMGVAGGSITHGDKRKMALYLIETAGSAEKQSQIDRWIHFAVRYPQRAHKSWAQSYRNHKNEIDGLVDRYAKRAELRQAAQASDMQPGEKGVAQASKKTPASTIAGSSVLGKRKTAPA